MNEDKELEDLFKEIEDKFIRPDKTVLIRQAQVLETEIHGDNTRKPIDDKKRLQNMPKCCRCGSVDFFPSGSCQICSVCGETQGGCGA